MSWAPVTGVLKQHCCVVAPDLRGHGLTSSVDDNLLSMESLTSDVTSLLVEMVNGGTLAKPPLSDPRPSTPELEKGVTCSAAQPATTSVHDGEHAPYEATESRCTAADEITGANECARVETRGGTVGAEGGDSADNLTGVHKAGDGLGEVGNSGASPEESPQHDVGESTESPIKVLLAGHSLGGSIAVRVAEAATDIRRRCKGRAVIEGVVAVDVVEGTALAALEDMHHVLNKIPSCFASIEEAIEWHLATGAVRNPASASTAVPSRLRDNGDGGVIWRTDLRKTEQHWRGWFEGLSEAFLALPMPKLLMVAGMDRLDTVLTAAHMRGSFQLKLVYGCGHSVQEDQPGEAAAAIISFAWRHSIIRRGRSEVTARSGHVLSDEEELKRKLARAGRPS